MRLDLLTIILLFLWRFVKSFFYLLPHLGGDILNLFKRKIYLFSPVNGESLSITKVNDEMFSNKLIGDGIAFKLYEDIVYSPCEGEIIAIAPTKHAIGIRARGGIEILLHVGLDTVNLEGEGFEQLVKQNEKISQGQPLLKINKKLMKEKKVDLITPLVIISKGYKLKMCNYGQVSINDVVIEIMKD